MAAAFLGAVSRSRLASAFYSSPLSTNNINVPKRASSGNHLYATAELPAERLCSLAKDFIGHKNAAGRGDSNLDPVFDMCSSDVDLYGLTGDGVRPGFVAFFDKFQSLHHELIEEPTVVGPTTVQYSFTKAWVDENGDKKTWKSIDPDKPRNKVERLAFDKEGMLTTVSVVEADDPLI